MHFNIWINDYLIQGLETIMRAEGKKRNTVIAEAVTEYIKQKQLSQWPDEIKNFNGIKGIKNWEGFEADRHGLKEPTEHIFEDDT